MSVTLSKPSRLALWIDEYGYPDQLRVTRYEKGPEDFETWVQLTITRTGDTIYVREDEIGGDTELKIERAYIVHLTEQGIKKLRDWKEFLKREASDLAEYRRLKEKFGDIEYR